MRPLKIPTFVLTGGGGPAIPGMIDTLKKAMECRIIAVDMDPFAAGFYLADKGIVIPAGGTPEFFPAIKKICEEESVDALISVVDEELVSVLDLEKIGVSVIQPVKSFTEICLDKYGLMKKLGEAGIGIPKTELAGEMVLPREIGFPLIAKPRVGRGSRGIHPFTDQKAYDLFCEENKKDLNRYIVQELVEGTEFTTSVVVWRDGEVQAVVPKEILCKRGVTKLAVTRKNQKIHDECVKIQNIFGANGPFNVQLRLDPKTGNPKIFEINPRFSTSITLTTASGIDELSGIAKQALYGRESHQFGEWREDVLMVRRTLDVFMPYEKMLNR